MSYHYGSYQPEPHYQASLPQNFPLYRGPQDIYSYGEDRSRDSEIHFAPGMNSGLHMVPQPQYSNVQHAAPVYYNSAPQPVLYSSQSYPQLQPQSRHFHHRLGFDGNNQPQRNDYLPPQPFLQNHGLQPQLQCAQSASYASTGPYEPIPNFGQGNSDPTYYPGLGFDSSVDVSLPSNSRQVQSPPDNNVLDELPPLKRTQGPKWEPKIAKTVKPRLHPQFSLSAQPKSSIKGSDRDWSTLKPGAIHTLIPVIPFMSSSLIPECLQDAATHRDSVIYLPRCSDFSGKEKDPRACINFSLDGMPGPYLLDLAKARVVIDGEDDKIFEQFGWRSSKFQIDWPGLDIPPEGFRVDHVDGRPRRRGELAAFLATRIAKIIINAQRGHALPLCQTQDLRGPARYWDVMEDLGTRSGSGYCRL